MIIKGKNTSLKSLTTHQRFKSKNLNINSSDNTKSSYLYLALYMDIIIPNIKLALLSLTLIEDCYKQKIISKELIRQFIIGIERIRGEQIC